MRPYIALFLTVLLVPTLAIGAVLTKTQIKYSSAYDVAIAYFQMTKQNLDLKKLITSDASYKRLQDSDKEKYYGAIYDDLTARTKKFVVGKSSLTVRMRVQAEIVKNPRAIKLKLDSRTLPYFPYQVFNETVTLMPEGIENFLLMPIETETELKRAEYFLKYNPALVLDLVPVYIGDKPVKIDQILQTIIICDIAQVRLVSGSSADVVWSYQSPKYDTTYDINLKGLYGGTSGVGGTGPGFSSPPGEVQGTTPPGAAPVMAVSPAPAATPAAQ